MGSIEHLSDSKELTNDRCNGLENLNPSSEDLDKLEALASKSVSHDLSNALAEHKNEPLNNFSIDSKFCETENIPNKNLDFNNLTESFSIPKNVWEWDINYEVAEGLRIKDFNRIANIEGLRREDWLNSTPLERFNTLQLLEKILAEIQHRPHKQVITSHMDDSWGYYTNSDDMIHCNSELINNPELYVKAIETIAHEGRHAYQWHAITHPNFHPNNKEVEYWTANLHNYLDGRLFGFELYVTQATEYDAFKYANIACEGILKALNK